MSELFTVPPGAMPVMLVVGSCTEVTIGWVGDLGSLPDLLEDVAAKLREVASAPTVEVASAND